MPFSARVITVFPNLGNLEFKRLNERRLGLELDSDDPQSLLQLFTIMFLKYSVHRRLYNNELALKLII